MTDETSAAAPAADGAPANDASTATDATTSPASTADTAAKATQTAELDGDDEEKAKSPSRSQRLQRKLQLLAAENEELRRSRPAARPEPDAGQGRDAAQDEEKPPKESDFNGDYLAYERALNAYNVRQAVRAEVRRASEQDRARRAEMDKRATEARMAERHRELVTDHMERVDELKQRAPDFDDVVKGAGIKVRDEVSDAILDSEKSALLVYHLAKNPDKAAELNSLTGAALARAIGRLEGAVRLPAAKAATSSDPPVQPLTGGAKPSFDPFKAEMADYAANYKARIAAKEAARR